SSHPARTATVDAVILTASAWNSFSADPKTPTPMPELPATRMIPFGGPASSLRGEDVPEWTSWRSDDIQPRLPLLDREPLFLVLRLAGYHASHRENMRIRNVEILQDENPEPILRQAAFPLKTARTL